MKIFQAVKKLNSISQAAIELSETTGFVYNFVQKPYTVQASNFSGIFDQLFVRIVSIFWFFF